FAGKDVVSVVMAHLRQVATPLHTVRAEVPPPLAGVVARMMAKDPARRFATPLEAAHALAPFATSAAAPAAPAAAAPGLSAQAATLADGDTGPFKPDEPTAGPVQPRRGRWLARATALAAVG